MSRVKVNITKTNFTLNCSNWANLKSLIPAIKLCNKGNTTGGDKLKAKEIEIKKEDIKLRLDINPLDASDSDIQSSRF